MTSFPFPAIFPPRGLWRPSEGAVFSFRLFTARTLTAFAVGDRQSLATVGNWRAP